MGLQEALWSLHQADHDTSNDETWCSSCHVEWPCPTARVLLANPQTVDSLELALERERDLRQALLEGSYFHVTHDGSVRHPRTCNDCRLLAEAMGDVLSASPA